jgi:hypothetical protein
MKNSTQFILITISIVLISCLLSCNNSKKTSNVPNSESNGIKEITKTPSVEPLQGEDNCCDIPYPAAQIGIEGEGLLDFFEITGYLSGYKMKFNLTLKPNFASASQAYLDYVKALHPCAKGIGSRFVISQGTNPGHTQRRMTHPKHLGFVANGGGVITYIGGSSFFDSYYQSPTPTPIPTTANLATTNSLLPNVLYGIEYGVWIEWIKDCNHGLSDEEIKKCFQWGNYQTFRVQINPPLLKNEKRYAILEILDKNNKVIESKKVNMKFEK